MSHGFRRDFVLPPIPSSLPPPLVEAFDNVERHRGNRQAIPMIVPVIILFFFLVAFFTIYLFRDILRYVNHAWLVQRRGLDRRPQQEEPADLTPGLSPSILVSFPVFPYASIKRLKRKCCLVCAICLSEFSDDDAVRLLTICNHAFHPECIDTWLVSHVTCPVCRCNLDRMTEEQGSCRITVEEEEPSRQDEDKSPPNSSHSSGNREEDEDDEYTLRLPDDVGERLVYLRTASRSGSRSAAKNADHQSRS